jgi:hypothetical protein
VSTTVFRFVIRALNRTTITAFTPHTIQPEEVTASLRKAAANVPGTTVVPADLAMHVDSHKSGSDYIFGTGGSLRFSAPQTNEVLASAAKAVADALLADSFGIDGEPEIDPKS